MKFIILLLLCSCAVAIAQPAGSNESSPSKKGSKEDSHLDSKDSGESNESNEDSSNESGRKDGGGGVLDPSSGQVTIPQPTPQQLEKLLDHVVEISSSLLGQRDIHSVRGLIDRIQSNPMGNIVWNLAILPFLRNISYFPGPMLTQLQSSVAQLFPLLNFFPPFVLARAIVQFVFSIISSIARIFVR